MAADERVTLSSARTSVVPCNTRQSVELSQFNARVVQKDAVESHEVPRAQCVELVDVRAVGVEGKGDGEDRVVAGVDREQAVRPVDLAHGALERLDLSSRGGAGG